MQRTQGLKGAAAGAAEGKAARARFEVAAPPVEARCDAPRPLLLLAGGQLSGYSVRISRDAMHQSVPLQDRGGEPKAH